MISRVILCVMMGGVGVNNMFPELPEPTKPLTTAQLQAKAKQKSISNVCRGKRKTKTVKELCKRWEGQQNA
jgi:hypothetical protein